MPTPRRSLGVAAVNGKIYAIGGFYNGQILNTVEEYDPVTDKWTSKRNMTLARYSLGVTVANNKIYAIGGNITCQTNTDNVEEYDPINNT